MMDTSLLQSHRDLDKWDFGTVCCKKRDAYFWTFSNDFSSYGDRCILTLVLHGRLANPNLNDPYNVVIAYSKTM